LVYNYNQTGKIPVPSEARHDDGVKVNYGKFGDLLAEVKAVIGRREVNSE